jgi:hypothetical protein
MAPKDTVSRKAVHGVKTAIREKRRETDENAGAAHDDEEEEAECYWDGWTAALEWAEQLIGEVL